MSNPSISYMKEYFAKAVELEKSVFVLREAHKKANQEIKALCSEKEREERIRSEQGERLRQLDSKYIEEEKKLTEKISEDKKNRPHFKRKAGGMIALLILIGIAFIAGQIATFVFGLEFLQLPIMIACIYASIPVIVILIISKVRAGRAKERLDVNTKRDINQEKADEQQSLSNSLTLSSRKIQNLNNNEKSLIQTQNMISESYQKASSALKKLYSKNLVAPKYHNFNAMATFYEYISTGRCLAVFGPDGVIDTYEDDIKMGIIISTLLDIRDIVADTNAKAGFLCDQAQIANQQLARVNSNLSAIKVSSAATAANTAAIANYCHSINESVHRIEYSYF